MRSLLALVAASTLLVNVQTAHADQILGFGQLGTTNLFFATNNGDGTTSLDGFASVNITNIAAGALDPNALFTFEAESIDAAQLLAGVIVTQAFEGTFSLTNQAGTFNYLSGAFGASLMLGGNGGTGSLFTSNNAGLAPLSFTSDLPLVLIDPKSFSLSLSNVDPAFGMDCAAVEGCTINSFTASFTGTADANLQEVPVPEPASMVLLGSGLVAIGAKLRRRKQCEGQS